MRIFMLGWEFPPFITGGLGTACQGLTKALSRNGIHITFVLPKPVDKDYQPQFLKMLCPQSGQTSKEKSAGQITHNYLKKLGDKFSGRLTFKAVDSILRSPYLSNSTSPLTGKNIYQTNYSWQSSKLSFKEDNLVEQAKRYAKLCKQLALKEDFDVIHAHDWFTFPAGIAVARATGKPLVVHVHSTEFDRAGEWANQQILQMEYEGICQADRVIAVSYLTKKIILEHYSADSAKIDVVHNGIELQDKNNSRETPKQDESPLTKLKANPNREKIVLFLGRITMQKGPKYFLAAAKRVLEKYSNVKFVVAGSGDRMASMVEQVAREGLGSKVLFTGFLNAEQVQCAFQMADVYVMPSVSEPFGIAPLEAISNKVPVIVSKTAGVGEVLNHALKVDFWDINLMAEKIVSILKHPPLSNTLCANAQKDVAKLTWDRAAMNCFDVYLRAIGIGS